MSRSGAHINVKKMAEGEKNKQKIYDSLLKKSMSRRECYEMINLTKNQFTHYINFLTDEGHVKVKVGTCNLYRKAKVHILTANKHHPFVARSEEQIQQELDEKKRRDELVKPHVRVVRLIDSRPYNFHKDENKKKKVGIQSSFNIL